MLEESCLRPVGLSLSCQSTIWQWPSEMSDFVEHQLQLIGPVVSLLSVVSPLTALLL
jgi:hypothetical protein